MNHDWKALRHVNSIVNCLLSTVREPFVLTGWEGRELGEMEDKLDSLVSCDSFMSDRTNGSDRSNSLSRLLN